VTTGLKVRTFKHKEVRMKVEQIHHVTIIVDDLEKACVFYESVLGLAPMNMINLDFPAQFYKVGERQQLHITEWEDAHSFRGHVCFQVDEFMPIFKRAKQMGVIDTKPWGKVRKLPDGAMQMFLRDPSDNLVEISCRAGVEIDPMVFADAQVEPGKSVYVSGRNDPRGRKRAKTDEEADAVNIG
jgi:catechol 2,3-dioxygenase-like lactoylglutathione lyase family enzyme